MNSVTAFTLNVLLRICLYIAVGGTVFVAVAMIGLDVTLKAFLLVALLAIVISLWESHSRRQNMAWYLTYSEPLSSLVATGIFAMAVVIAVNDVSVQKLAIGLVLAYYSVQTLGRFFINVFKGNYPKAFFSPTDTKN